VRVCQAPATSHWHLVDAFTVFSPVDDLAESCDVSVGVWASATTGLTAHLCQVARPLFACTLRWQSGPGGEGRWVKGGVGREGFPTP
jgi:hypothetical protein